MSLPSALQASLPPDEEEPEVQVPRDPAQQPGLLSAGPSPSDLYPPPTPTWAPPKAYRHPSKARLYGVGIAKTIGYLVFLVYVPYRLLSALSAFSHSSFFEFMIPIPLDLVLFGGIAIAVLAGISHASKPTSLFGPFSLALAGTKVAYLVLMSAYATVTLVLSGGGSSGGGPLTFTFSTGWGLLLLLIAIGPALGAAAAFITTVEDARHPGERLPFDYPVK